MNKTNFTDNDWKLFRERIAGWQEHYIQKLIMEYLGLLGSNKKASTKFWDLDKRIKQDKRCSGVQLQLKKSDFIILILTLLRDEVITYQDLDDFSEELKETIKYLMKMEVSH